MDRLKKSLSIVLAGYLSSLGFYFIWFFTKWSYSSYAGYSRDAYHLEIGAVVFIITGLYFLFLLLILSYKALQNVWISSSLVSIITLLTFFLIPFTYHVINYKSNDFRLSFWQDKTINTIDKNEPERKILAANKKEIQKQLEDTKEKIQTEKNRKKEIEAKLNNAIATNEVANKSITELQAKLKIEREENDKLRKQLEEVIRESKSKDEIILALRSNLEKEHKTKGGVVVQAKSNKDFYRIKPNPAVGNNDSDTKNHEINFKVQILSSDTRLATNSQRFKGLKNVWEYKDGGLYKYTVGNKKDLKSASASQSELRRKGFNGAFVVTFKNGERIPVQEALKLLK
jgi:hypothetical protein